MSKKPTPVWIEILVAVKAFLQIIGSIATLIFALAHGIPTDFTTITAYEALLVVGCLNPSVGGSLGWILLYIQFKPW